MKDDRIKETDNAPIEAEDLELISGGRFNPGKNSSNNDNELIPTALKGVSGEGIGRDKNDDGEV